MTKLSAILLARCPHCRVGQIFKHGPFAYSKFTEVYPTCSHCGLHYEPEPGFWQGAMYVGYAFSVAILITCFVAVYVLGHNPATWVYISVTIGIAVAVAPLNFRYSRVLMLYLFGDY